MSETVSTDYLVVTMKASEMTSRVMRAGCGDKLHLLGWSWEVVSTNWWGKDNALTKSLTLHRTNEHISPAEAIHTNCYPVCIDLTNPLKENEAP